jgi:uncharacterized protein
MESRPDERLPYLELARQGARLERVVQARGLERLAAIAPGQGDLRVELDFHLDAHGRPWVSGSADVTVTVTCQRCLERFDTAMRGDFSLCIVRDPDLASVLGGEMDVLVAKDDVVSVADVVEDELILSLPERLCTETPCPYAPALEYPADGEVEATDENPFHVLSVLKHK